MAIEDYEQQIEELASQFDNAELLITAAIAASGAATAAQARQTSAQVAQITADLMEQVLAWIERHAPEMYRRAIAEALASQGGEPRRMSEAEIARYRERVDEIVQSDLHDESLNQLAEDLVEQLGQATAHMESDAKRQLRRMAREALREARERVEVLPQGRSLARGMEGAGVRFTDKSGRRWKPGRYAEMVLRTSTGTIMNTATVNAATEIGSPGVRIFDGGPGDVDEPCTRANGQVWSVAYFAANLLEHPNCRRAGAPLPSTWRGELDRGDADIREVVA